MEEVFAELFEIVCELHIAIASTTRLFLFPTCHFGFKARVRVQLALHFSRTHPPLKSGWGFVLTLAILNEENSQDAFDTACVAVAPCSRTGLL